MKRKRKSQLKKKKKKEEDGPTPVVAMNSKLRDGHEETSETSQESSRDAYRHTR